MLDFGDCPAENVANVIGRFDARGGVVDRRATLDPFIGKREELAKTLAVQADAAILHQNPVKRQLIGPVFLVVLTDNPVLFLHAGTPFDNRKRDIGTANIHTKRSELFVAFD